MNTQLASFSNAGTPKRNGTCKKKLNFIAEIMNLKQNVG